MEGGESQRSYGLIKQTNVRTFVQVEKFNCHWTSLEFQKQHAVLFQDGSRLASLIAETQHWRFLFQVGVKNYSTVYSAFRLYICGRKVTPVRLYFKTIFKKVNGKL